MVSLKSQSHNYFARMVHKKPIVPPAPVYHSHTTIKNNFNMGIRFTAILQRRLTVLRNRPEADPLWFIFGRPSSHYEWYVQKSMLRDVRNAYRELVYYTRDSNKFLRFPEMKQRRAPKIHKYPKLLSPDAKQPSPAAASSARTNEYYTESNIRIDRQVEQLRKEISDIRSDFHNDRNIYNMVNINSILDQVYSGIEEKLKRQRLKKGF